MGNTVSTNNAIYQSKYLYLQAAGSTGNDGSLEGMHLRWELMSSLGDVHLPKGTLATSTNGFNKPNDFVNLFRSKYINKYPVTLDLSTVTPSVIVNSTLSLDDGQLIAMLPDEVTTNGVRLWIFLPDKLNTNDTVYVRFCDTALFDSIDPTLISTLAFIQAYGNGLIEVWVKNKLCFASNICVSGFGTDPQLKVESISVNTDEDSTPSKVVSCRKVFDKTSIGIPTPSLMFLAQEDENLILQENLFRIYLENSPVIVNLIGNGNFENGSTGFETEYTTPYSQQSGQYQLVEDAQTLDNSWVCKPVSGSTFMAVSGSTTVGVVVWKEENIAVDSNTAYTFSGFLANLLNCDPLEIPEIEVHITGVQSNTTKIVQYSAPVMQGKWAYMETLWYSGSDTEVSIEIVNINNTITGNKFGLDNLIFTKSDIQDYGRVVAENIQKVRFTASDCYLTKIDIETYDNYIANINTLNGWTALGDFGLTTDDAVVFAQLEKTPNTIHNKWPKYKGATVNILNYQDRWNTATIDGLTYNGLKNGVIAFVNLSDEDSNNPTAQINTNADASGSTGNSSGDGSITTNYLDMLHIVSMDYHAARMLGLGYIDDAVDANPDTEYIYVAQYGTNAALPEGSNLNHIFATPPVKKYDEKLPPALSLASPVKYGLIQNRGTNDEVNLTDDNGYTFDGQARFVNLYLDSVDDETPEAGAFFVPPTEFCSVGETSGVFVGLDYRKQGDSVWSKDVITPDAYYYTDEDGHNGHKEVCPLPYPTTNDGFLYQHKETQSGVHDYAAYSINWFSRPSSYDNVVSTDDTEFFKPNTLLPPINVKAQLIQKEGPLFLTTQTEQDLLNALSNENDQTLVRLTFDYTQAHDITYEYGSSVEIFFRNDPPASVTGRIKLVNPISNDKTLSEVHTEAYSYVNISKTVTYTPQVSVQDASKFIGGAFAVKDKTFIVQNVVQPTDSTEGAVFIVKNIETSSTSNINSDLSAAPEYESAYSYTDPSSYKNEVFTVIENMAEAVNWQNGATEPLARTVQIGDSNWEERVEVVVPNVWKADPNDSTKGANVAGVKGVDSQYTQKVRGIWDTASIVQKPQLVPNPNDANNPLSQNIGVYEITFDTKIFKEHPQYKDSNPVFWYKGILRVNTVGDPNGIKKTLEVLNILSSENENIKLSVLDSSYVAPPTGNPPSEGNIPETTGIEVNYYPGYKVYLYADVSGGLTADNILPATGTRTKTSYLGTRTKETEYGYTSKMSIPSPIIALEIVEPLAPEKPVGGTFATRPDFYNKSTYSFTMHFQHEPFAIACYRASERMILEALYEPATIDTIQTALAALGDDPFFTLRWQSLVNFDYPNEEFHQFPTINGYAFPNPDKQLDVYGRTLFKDETDSKVFLLKMKDAIYTAFLPLTEQPLFYKYISSDSKYPLNVKQKITDSSGSMLDPNDAINNGFLQAPMARKTGGNNYEILFTDFSLDGSANNFYFYCGIELSNRMQFSEYGQISGPIQLVNTTAPEPPKIKNITSQIFDDVNGIPTAVMIDVSNYNPIQKITKFSLYRSITPMDAISVRNMVLVAELDLEVEQLLNADIITITDDFSEDGNDIPYGESLFYKVVALRKVMYADSSGNAVTDYVPSQPSKTVLANIVDNVNPIAPLPVFSSDTAIPATTATPATLPNGKLSWNKVTHNATYYVYQMSVNGNWNLLETIESNDTSIEYSFSEPLVKTDSDGNAIYYRFKVDVENSSGLFNLEENAITV